MDDPRSALVFKAQGQVIKGVLTALTAWIYNGNGRFGSVWIGQGSQPTCACDYYSADSETGLGKYTNGSTPLCSTWVR